MYKDWYIYYFIL